MHTMKVIYLAILALAVTATAQWVCNVTDVGTRSSTVFITLSTPLGATSVQFNNFTTAAVNGPWTAGDQLVATCSAY